MEPLNTIPSLERCQAARRRGCARPRGLDTVKDSKMLRMPSASAATVSPARRLRGRVRVPGDKSISHRYALLAALADGVTRLSNYAPGADCRSTLACLRALGVEVSDEADVITIVGRGFRAWRSPSGPLDAGNSGTTMRMLAGLLAAQPFTTHPGRRRVAVAPADAAGDRAPEPDGRAHRPRSTVTRRSRSRAARFTALPMRPRLPSAQVKSAVLLAGLHADGTTSVTEPAQTRDHTERAFAAFGIDLEIDGLTVSVDGGQPSVRSSSPSRAISRRRRSGWSPPRRCPDRASRSRTSG